MKTARVAQDKDTLAQLYQANDYGFRYTKGMCEEPLMV